jgi:BMFP domain-containing protein YqiC
VKVVGEGQKIRMFDRAGNEILPLREMLEQERRRREELERRVAELEQKLQQQTLK